MRIILSGGGTAGHVLPHIAVVKAVKKRQKRAKFLYVGSAHSVEEKYAALWGIKFKSVPTGKLRRYFSLANAKDAIKVPLGILKSLWIIAIFRPHVIFSKGGFASVPVIIAGRILRKPIVIHDSDAKPGLTTKISQKFARKILLGYKEASAKFPKEKVVITGIPIRDEIYQGDQKAGLDLTGFTAAKPIVLIMGGSLGATHVNKAVEQALPEILKVAQVVHLTGKGKSVKGRLGKYKPFEYVDEELPHLYAISDLIIGRAGANSLAEIQALKKPSILIPLGPPVSHGDQIANAKVLEERGGCVIIPDQDLTAQSLTNVIKKIVTNPATLKKMSRKAYHPFNPKAADKIAKIILNEGRN